MKEVTIRVFKIIRSNFNKDELTFAEKIHLCSLLENEFNINIDFIPTERTSIQEIVNIVERALVDYM